MKAFSRTTIFIGLLSTCMAIAAQQSVTNPAPIATPPVASAQTPPPQTPTQVHPAQPGAASLPDVSLLTYVIGPDDSIRIEVWKEPTLSGIFPVRPDGMVSVALLGDVKAAGFTPMDLATDLTARLKKFVTDPNVTVGVAAVNSKKIFFVGEVGKVGPMPLNSSVTVLQAIAAAGGLTQYANKTKIYILRTENGKQRKIPYNYKKALKTGDQQGVTLTSGDTIVVP